MRVLYMHLSFAEHSFCNVWLPDGSVQFIYVDKLIRSSDSVLNLNWLLAHSQPWGVDVTLLGS